MSRGHVDGNSTSVSGLTPRVPGGRSSRMKKRSECRIGDANVENNGKTNGVAEYKDESLTEIEAELIQTGTLTIIVRSLLDLLIQEGRLF